MYHLRHHNVKKKQGPLVSFIYTFIVLYYIFPPFTIVTKNMREILDNCG